MGKLYKVKNLLFGFGIPLIIIGSLGLIWVMQNHADEVKTSIKDHKQATPENFHRQIFLKPSRMQEQLNKSQKTTSTERSSIDKFKKEVDGMVKGAEENVHEIEKNIAIIKEVLSNNKKAANPYRKEDWHKLMECAGLFYSAETRFRIHNYPQKTIEAIRIEGNVFRDLAWKHTPDTTASRNDFDDWLQHYKDRWDKRYGRADDQTLIYHHQEHLDKINSCKVLGHYYGFYPLIVP